MQPGARPKSKAEKLGRGLLRPAAHLEEASSPALCFQSHDITIYEFAVIGCE